MVQNGLDLNFAAQASEPSIFGKAYAILTKPDRVVNCAVSRPFGFRDGMVDPSRVLLDLEIFADQWRCQETINVIVRIEDEPGTSEIAPVMLQRLRVQLARFS